jgi:predicted dehydrogenase
VTDVIDGTDPTDDAGPADRAGTGTGGMVRVGIVGAGLIATRHADALAGFPDATVVAVADPDLERARALAARTSARAYRTVAEMTGEEELDALYTCVPPFAHGEPEETAVRLGLPLFVEKPLAADWRTAAEIGEMVLASGVVTGTGYHLRCLDTVVEARQRLGDRVPGLVTGHWFGTVPPAAWWVRRDQSGGQLVEQATHVVDLARFLVGEVTSVFAVGSSHGHCPQGDIDETSAAVLRFASGAVGSLSATCLSTEKRVGLEIVAPDLALGVSESHLTVHDPGGVTVREAVVDPKVAVDRDFIDAVKGDAPATRVPYEEALRSHRVACALAESAIAGRPVELPGDDAGAVPPSPGGQLSPASS